VADARSHGCTTRPSSQWEIILLIWYLALISKYWNLVLAIAQGTCLARPPTKPGDSKLLIQFKHGGSCICSETDISRILNKPYGSWNSRMSYLRCVTILLRSRKEMKDRRTTWRYCIKNAKANPSESNGSYGQNPWPWIEPVVQADSSMQFSLIFLHIRPFYDFLRL
jgi:hypothetical protein